MGKYLVETDQGKFEVEVEDEPKTEGMFGTSIGQDSEILQKARIPSRAVENVSKKLMDATEPTSQSVAVNAAKRLPQTIGSIGAQLVSDSITPESLAMVGGLKLAKLSVPALKALGRFIGSGAEKLSGLSYKTPGVLAEVVKNPSLPFKPGIDAANEIYAAKADPTKIRDAFKAILGKKEFVEAAQQALKDGTLTADEALIARQTLDSIKNQIPRASYFNTRGALNELAKTKFAGADEAYQTAVKAENLRNISPVNKTAGQSKLGQYFQAAALGGGHFVNPYMYAAAPVVSPFAQGVAASGVGLAGKAVAPVVQRPQLGVLSEMIRRELERREQ